MGKLWQRGAVAALACSVGTALAVEKFDPKHLKPAQRLTEIRHAAVWRPTDVESLNLLKGPDKSGAFQPNETVTCTYVDRKLAGATPKFACEIEPGDEVKVKYGADNGEVFSEVAGTRLLWALGFGADRMYSVHVLCRGCPEKIAREGERRSDGVYFDVAAIERKMPGVEMRSSRDEGWAWHELGQVAETAGGSPRAHVEALELIAVFIQHTDSKAQQQRLMCLSTTEEIEKAAECQRPFMMINDLGATFGKANLFNRAKLSDTNLERWRRAEVWKDPKKCIGNLPISQTGTLENPVISEPGRKFLADLLVRLSDQQLHDLFEASRVHLRSRNPAEAAPPGTVDEWVDAFKTKRDEIVHHQCPS